MKKLDIQHFVIIVVFFASLAGALAKAWGGAALNMADIVAFMPTLGFAAVGVAAFLKSLPATLQGAVDAGQAVLTPSGALAFKKKDQRGFSQVRLMALVTGAGISILACMFAISETRCTPAQVVTATPVAVNLTNTLCKEIASLTGSPTVEFVCQEIGLVTGGAAAAPVEQHFIVLKTDAPALAFFRSHIANAYVAPDAGGH